MFFLLVGSFPFLVRVARKGGSFEGVLGLLDVKTVLGFAVKPRLYISVQRHFTMEMEALNEN